MPHKYKYVYVSDEEAEYATEICTKVFNDAWKDLKTRFHIKRWVLCENTNLVIRKTCTVQNPEENDVFPYLLDIEYSYCIFDWMGPFKDLFNDVENSLLKCGEKYGFTKTELTDWGIFCVHEKDGTDDFGMTVRLALMTGYNNGSFLYRNQDGVYAKNGKFSLRKEKEYQDVIFDRNAVDEFRRLYLYYRSRQFSQKYAFQSPYAAYTRARGDAYTKAMDVMWQVSEYSKWNHKNPI